MLRARDINKNKRPHVRGWLRSHGLKRWQLISLFFFIIIGLLHGYIASDSGKALIPYAYNTIDKANRNVGPFDFQQISSLYYRHWLGTDSIGRDVLAGLLSGTNVALRIGFFAVLLAAFIGCFLGYLSGFVGNKGFRIDGRWLTSIAIGLLVSGFYIVFGSLGVKLIFGLLGLALLGLAVYLNDKEDYSKYTVAVPFDTIIMRLIEVFRSIPIVFMILIALSLFRSANYWNIILVIALVRWPTITRYLRAEIMAIKEENFIIAAEALGLPRWKIFIDTVFPLAASPVIVASAFAFASAILLESTLSFLGIGVPADSVTWASILKEARHYFSSWWLAFFPGMMIFLVIYLFNSIGDSINDRLRRNT